MSVWDEKPDTELAGTVYNAEEIDAWLERVKDRHLQLIEENNERREKIGTLFDAFQETNNQLKAKKEHVDSLKMLNEALLTAIDLERKISVDLKEKPRRLQAGEVDYLSFQYHVMSQIPLARILAANYCPQCKNKEKCKGTYVKYCEFHSSTGSAKNEN